MGKIAVVGSINMDMVVKARRFPKKGETLLGENLEYFPGGKGANQAVAIARLGGRVEMFGCIGADATGDILRKNLADAGVDVSNLRESENLPSGTAFITVADGDNSIVIVEGANAQVDRDYIDSVKNEILKADAILLQNEIPYETNEHIIRLCHEHKKPIIFNPAPARMIAPELIEKLAYLTPNEQEAAYIFGSDSSLNENLLKYPEKLIVTQGACGVSMAQKDGEIIQIAAFDATVVDTTGAGDTLNGAFAFMIGEGYSTREALSFANAAASCAIESYGAQKGMPCYSQVAKRLNEDK